MSDDPCKQTIDEFILAAKEWDEREKELTKAIFPSGNVTRELLEKIRAIDEKRDIAKDKYFKLANEVIDCKKG